MSGMATESLRRQVAQLIVVRASGYASDRQRRYPQWELSNSELQRLLGEGIGGVILLGGSCTEIFQRCQTLQRWATQPLLLCADVEEGMGQRFEGGTWLVPPMALGLLYQEQPERAIALAERYGHCTGDQALACGLNWVLAPVCDVNNNPSNPVINVRAWGEDPATVSALACAFHRGLAAAGVLGCAKHFPGHGDTTVDSHLELPVLNHSRERLEHLELPPFQALIKAGIESVMTAHLLLKALDPDHPATLSAVVLNQLLRDQLGFQGLVVTDALVMEAITRRYGPAEAAVQAFAAGADLILMPADADAAIEAICAALASGHIPIAKLTSSLQRRQQAFDKLSQASPQDQEQRQLESLERAEDISLMQELVSSSLQLRHPHGISAKGGGVNLVRTDLVLPSPILTSRSAALTLPAARQFEPIVCHNLGISPWQNHKQQPLALDRFRKGPVLLQLFVRGNPFSGNRDRDEPWAAALQQLQQQQRLAGLVIYGSPYLWRELLNLLEPEIPAAFSPAQTGEAQRQVMELMLESKEIPAMSKPAAEEFTD